MTAAIRVSAKTFRIFLARNFIFSENRFGGGGSGASGLPQQGQVESLSVASADGAQVAPQTVWRSVIENSVKASQGIHGANYAKFFRRCQVRHNLPSGYRSSDRNSSTSPDILKHGGGGDVFVAATLPKPPPGALPQVGEVNNEFGGSTFRVVTAAHAGSPFVRALLNERGNLMKIDYYRGFFGRNGRLLEFVGGGGYKFAGSDIFGSGERFASGDGAARFVGFRGGAGGS